MPSSNALAVTASVPYFNARIYIRRAVESLLTQTHRHITIVVVNDGDPNPPWREPAHFDGPRLVRFSLDLNYGPYFSHQLILGASTTPWFLVQDADDWSTPTRVASLLHTLISEGSDLRSEERRVGKECRSRWS